jgi:hypothetical protein
MRVARQAQPAAKSHTRCHIAAITIRHMLPGLMVRRSDCRMAMEMEWR